MWKSTYSMRYSGITRQKVWDMWVDIPSWPRWHKDLDFCEFEGGFSVGNHFLLKPKGMGAVKILLTQVKEGYSFTDCTSFPGAKMYDDHEIEETSEGVIIKNTLRLEGPLSFLWRKLVAQKVADSIPEKMDALVRCGKSSHE